MKKIAVILLAFVLTSCYVSKTLERDVNVSLNESFFVTVSNTGNSTFSGKYSQEEYKQAFIEGMKAEFAGSHIILTESNTEFMVSITELIITESSKKDTVSDADSKDNGKVYELSALKLSAKGAVKKADGANVSDWWADKNKEEKVTSMRSGGQMITGNNKDNNSYREKEFSDDKALDLARQCGRRSGARIVNDIVRALK